MNPVAVPSGLKWKDLPTIDDLQSQSGLKIAALRGALRAVDCYRCPDKTVRYDAQQAASALEPQEPSETELDELAPGTTIDLTFLYNKVLSILGDVRRDYRETLKLMLAPLERGLALQDKLVLMLEVAVTRLEARNDKHESDYDRLIVLTESLLSAQSDRDLKARKQEQQHQTRSEMVGLVKQQVPAIVQKWALTSEASEIVEFFHSLDPIVVSAVVDSGVLDDKQTKRAGALLEMLKRRKAAAAAAAAANHAPPSAPTPVDTDGTAAS